jgi:predicted peptidase
VKKTKILAILLTIAILISMAPSMIIAAPSAPATPAYPAFPDPNPDVVRTERVYLAMTSGTGAFADIPAGDGVPLKYREYYNAFFLDGAAPTAKAPLKVATDFIPTAARPGSGLGPYSGIYINAAGIYEFGFNAAGLAIEFEKLPFDANTGYGAPDTIDKTIRIGQFGDMAGDMHNTYKYDENTKAYIVTGTNAALALAERDIEDLVLDNNDAVRIFYDYVSMTDRTLTEIFITETAGAGTMASTYFNRCWSEGVKWDDPDYGYDGYENPYPVQFSLYDPVAQAGKPDDAKYPLYIWFHGHGGGASKTGVAGNDGWNIGYTNYQNLFETNTPGVNGAYVMSPRTNQFVNSGLESQGWLMGYRSDSNPRFAAGDESYKGKCTQAAAVIADIEWLLDTYPNIDRNRIYLGSHSAGGYIVWQVLFEAARQGKGDLISAAIPNQAAFFPSGGQLATDFSEVELGLEDKLLSMKDTPIWTMNSLTDGTCTWACTMGDKFRMTDSTEYGMNVNANINDNGVVPMTKIGNATTLWEALRNLKSVGGSPLSRTTALVNMGHADTVLLNNNKWPSTQAPREGVSPTTYTRIYAEQPAVFNERTPGTALAYTFGANSKYSEASYEDSIIDWYNLCGNATEAKRTAVTSLKIDSPAMVTVSRNSKIQLSAVLNPGASASGVQWSVSDTAYAIVDPVTGEVNVMNRMGIVVLTAKDLVSGISYSIVLRIT